MESGLTSWRHGHVATAPMRPDQKESWRLKSSESKNNFQAEIQSEWGVLVSGLSDYGENGTMAPTNQPREYVPTTTAMVLEYVPVHVHVYSYSSTGQGMIDIPFIYKVNGFLTKNHHCPRFHILKGCFSTNCRSNGQPTSRPAIVMHCSLPVRLCVSIQRIISEHMWAK